MGAKAHQCNDVLLLAIFFLSTYEKKPKNKSWFLMSFRPWNIFGLSWRSPTSLYLLTNTRILDGRYHSFLTKTNRVPTVHVTVRWCKIARMISRHTVAWISRIPSFARALSRDCIATHRVINITATGETILPITPGRTACNIKGRFWLKG